MQTTYEGMVEEFRSYKEVSEAAAAMFKIPDTELWSQLRNRNFDNAVLEITNLLNEINNLETQLQDLEDVNDLTLVLTLV